PSTSALANDVTSVVAAAWASAVTAPLLLELAGELERQDHGGGEDHHDADADHQPRVDQVAEDAHDEAQDHQRDERARLGPRAGGERLGGAKSLDEWSYRKQRRRIQAEERGAGWEAVQEDIFSEDFRLARPRMTAIASEEPVVLLIDEIDKTDQEFEAMLLELL